MNAPARALGKVWFVRFWRLADLRAAEQIAMAQLDGPAFDQPPDANIALMQTKPRRVGRDFLVQAKSPALHVGLRFSSPATKEGRCEWQFLPKGVPESEEVLAVTPVAKGEVPFPGLAPSVFDHGFTITTGAKHPPSVRHLWFVGFDQFESIDLMADAVKGALP